MDSSKSFKRKKNPPSRQRRNAIRAFLYRWRHLNPVVESKATQATQTDTLFPEEPLVQHPEVTSTSKEKRLIPVDQGKLDLTDIKIIKPKDPESLYVNFEEKLRLSRLEEFANLNIAVRHVTRHLHPKGEKITFPVPEAMDRLQLRSVNLPTDPNCLKDLLEKAFIRRGEWMDMEELYRDLVMAHGRIAIDIKQKWPLSHVHTYHP